MVSVSLWWVRKWWPALEQTLAQLQVIVNFAVKDHPEAVVFVGDGLAAGDQIDDGQAPDGQGNLPVLIIARIVRPPVSNAVAHPGQQGPVAPAGKTANSTHGSTNQKRGKFNWKIYQTRAPG